MIHFLTAHRGGRWVDVQLASLQRHLREPYEVWASVEDVPTQLASRFDHSLPMRGGHAEKLNLLWQVVAEEAADDDIVVFLDSDTLLIADPLPVIREALADHALVAVKRVENAGEPQPHPCFAAARAGAWRDLGCDWSGGYRWRTATGEIDTDLGSNLLRELESRGISWSPLHRTNTFDLHPVFFGVYEGLIYHHGAGSRRFPLARPDTAQTPWRAARFPPLRFLVNVPVAMRRRRRMRANRRLSNEVFEQLTRDPEFWRRFVT